MSKRSPAKLEELANTRHVVLAVDGTVRCDDCQATWPAPTGPSGQPTGLFWLCPTNCNMTQRVALRIVREHYRDGVEYEPERIEAAEVKLASTSQAPRKELENWMLAHAERMDQATLDKGQEYADAADAKAMEDLTLHGGEDSEEWKAEEARYILEELARELHRE